MEIKQITLRDLMMSEDNIRTQYDDESINELASSIRSQGLLSPLVVMPRGVGYQILAGHRRYKALVAVHDRDDVQVPCIVKDSLDTAGYTQMMLVENLQRVDLDPIDEAHAFQRLVDSGMTRDAIAKAIGKSGAYITKRMALLNLPEPLIAGVKSKDLPLDTAYKLSSLSSETLANVIKKAEKDVTSLNKINNWEVDSLKRREQQKLDRELLADIVAKFNTVVTDLPKDQTYRYVGRYDGTNIYHYMPGDDDVVVNRGSFILVYAPSDVAEEDDEWDVYHEQCNQIRKAYRDEQANYLLAANMFMRGNLDSTSWNSRMKLFNIGITHIVLNNWDTQELLERMFNLEFEDDEKYEAWVNASDQNAMKAFLTIAYYNAFEEEHPWLMTLLEQNGISKPAQPEYPEQPDDDDDDEEEFVDDDDETSYVDDTPDESLAYEGSEYDPFE